MGSAYPLSSHATISPLAGFLHIHCQLKKHVNISSLHYQKGRGSQSNPHNRFSALQYEKTDDAVMPWQLEEEEPAPRTQLIEVFPKNILSKNNSPDVPFTYSINPYNGCEHGCVYCYARPTHEYWGYSAGVDFEEKILYKPNGHEMLRGVFRKPSYQPELIVLSGNTDCYQPVERKLQLTRKLLEVFLEHRHPVGIITKNALILRDLDILKQLNEMHLVHVVISITTLDEEIRRTLEPRTSSAQNRLKTVETLSNAGIPVSVNMAPIIMGINSDEIFDIVKASAQCGAHSVNYTMARLNGAIAGIFEDWLRKVLPQRADKVLHQIMDSHGGSLNDSRFGNRMRGEGQYAQTVANMFRIARKKYLPEKKIYPTRFDLFHHGEGSQLSLF